MIIVPPQWLLAEVTTSTNNKTDGGYETERYRRPITATSNKNNPNNSSAAETGTLTTCTRYESYDSGYVKLHRWQAYTTSQQISLDPRIQTHSADVVHVCMPAPLPQYYHKKQWCNYRPADLTMRGRIVKGPLYHWEQKLWNYQWHMLFSVGVRGEFVVMLLSTNWKMYQIWGLNASRFHHINLTF